MLLVGGQVLKSSLKSRRSCPAQLSSSNGQAPKKTLPDKLMRQVPFCFGHPQSGVPGFRARQAGPPFLGAFPRRGNTATSNCLPVVRNHGSVVWGTFKSLRLRPPTPEAYGKTADFGTLCIPGSSQRLDPSAALLSSSDRSRLAALNVMLTPCPVP